MILSVENNERWKDELSSWYISDRDVWRFGFVCFIFRNRYFKPLYRGTVLRRLYESPLYWTLRSLQLLQLISSIVRNDLYRCFNNRIFQNHSFYMSNWKYCWKWIKWYLIDDRFYGVCIADLFSACLDRMRSNWCFQRFSIAFNTCFLLTCVSANNRLYMLF